MSHLLAFLFGAFAALILMIYDGVYGPVRLRWKPEQDDEPGGGFG